MQPYFFPGLGYFDLMRTTDRWILFDTVQYRRHGWLNRNRILHPSSGWQYVIAPLKKHHRDTPIRDIEVREGNEWKRRIFAQIAHYKKHAPYYTRTAELVEDALDTDDERLVQVDAFILQRCCEVLGISASVEILSEMDLDLGEVQGPGDWALRISEALGADGYVNPPGGRDLFDPEAFSRCGIELEIRSFPDLTYTPRGLSFEPGLSIIDVLMWNPLEVIHDHLDRVSR